MYRSRIGSPRFDRSRRGCNQVEGNRYFHEDFVILHECGGNCDSLKMQAVTCVVQRKKKQRKKQGCFSLFEILNENGCIVSAVLVELALAAIVHAQIPICSYMNQSLTQVPSHIPDDCSEVNLSTNNITHLPADIFSNLTQCTELNLRDNQIIVVQSGSFTGLTDLQELYLSGNQISVIENRAFTQLNHLLHLNVDNNRLSVIHRGSLSGLRNLATLSLQRNNISVIEKGAFTELNNLQYLNASWSKISVIETFTGLPDLLDLWTYSNQMPDMENGPLGGGVGLSSLQKLPLHILLSVIENGTFTGLSNLQELYLQHNQISAIKNWAFPGLTNLHKLFLHWNKISVIEKGSLTGLTSLQTLYLYHNKISLIQNGTFTGLGSLKTLWLQGNQISVIENGTFTGLSDLQILNLGTNQISVIETRAFTGLINLHELCLYNNLLESLDSDFYGLPLGTWAQPRTMELALSDPSSAEDKPWQCETLCWLKDEEQGRVNGRKITWFVWEQKPHKPECKNGVHWDEMTCVGTRHNHFFVPFVHFTSREGTTTFLFVFFFI